MNIPAYREREKPCKKLGGKQQKNIVVEPCRVGEREKKVLKKWFEQVKYEFLKNLIPEIQLIETDRDSLKNFKTISKQFRLI